MSAIHLIAAIGLSGQIGLDGKVPWHNDPVFAELTKRDLEQFARMTSGGILIMGSATAKRLPENFRAGSRELVIWSTRLNTTPPELLASLHARHPHRDIWICGGEKTYSMFIPYVDWHHISVIPYVGPADRYMPTILPRPSARKYL